MLFSFTSCSFSLSSIDLSIVCLLSKAFDESPGLVNSEIPSII